MGRDNYWTRRITRRRALATGAAGATGLAALALAGCGDDDDDDDDGGSQPTTSGVQPGTATAPTPTPKSETIKRDGVYNVRQTAPFASINPWKGLDSGLTWAFYIYDHLFYTPLDTLKPELFLATSIEQPEPTKIIFKLGEGKFHNKAPANGRAVTARDVKASYETTRKQPGVSQTTFSALVFKNMETPDDKTVVCNLNTPDGWAFTTAALSGPIFGSIHPEEVTATPDFLDKEIVGSGRFQFTSHQNGTNFRLDRFANWRVKDEPYLAGMQWKLIQEQAAALAAFSAKEIDVLGLTNKVEKEQLVAKHGKDITIDSELSRSMWMVQLRGDGRYADPRVRRAFNLALNRKEYIDLMALGDGQMSGIIAPAFKSVQLTEKEYQDLLWKHDPAEGKRLLTEAGFDFSQEVEIKFATLGDNFSKFAQITSSQLEKNLGVKTKIVGEDLAKWLQQSLYGSDYKDVIVYPTLAYEEPMTYMVMYEKQIGGRPNWGKFFDDELDGMIRKLNQELNDSARFEQVKELQRKAYGKAAPAFPIFVKVDDTAYWNHVKGRVTGRGSFGLFNGKVYIDKG